MPEGLQFSWRTSNGRTARAPLLTPPSYQAVQRQDGTWYRTPRIPGIPRPYSLAWYREYLRTYGLPSYFLRPGHISMLIDSDEAALLQWANAASAAVPEALPFNFLERQYPGEVFFPEPAQLAYRLEGLSEGRRANLARHHPALAVSFPSHIFVLPGGHIVLRTEDEAEDCPVISETDIRWLPLDHGTVAPSSYHQDSTGFHPLSLANQSSNREALVQSAINRHAIINPMEDIPGPGELRFLSEADRLEAQRRGYATAHDVSMARRRRDLAVGTGINAGPVVVFWPDADTLNPTEQPPGPGAWRFLTSAGDTSNAELAAIQFGGSRSLPARPSASQIRQLGQLFVQEGVTNLAAQIDLVWVAGAVDVDDALDLVLDEADLPDEENDDDSSGSSQPQASGILGTTPGGLIIDTTNGGEHDQTGGERPEHQTMSRHGGRTITVDRSRAWVGYPEPHKMECYSSRGWRKWTKADDMDWKDKKKVDYLNKWREQTYNRAKWPALRDVKREDYELVQREFVMEAIKAVEGDRAKMDMESFAAEFHRRFSNRARNETGLQSLVDRLRIEFKTAGGLVPRNPRGWKQRQMSKAARGNLKGGQSRPLIGSEDNGDENGGEGDGEGDDGEGEGGEGEGGEGEGGEGKGGEGKGGEGEDGCGEEDADGEEIGEDADGEEVGEDGDEDLAEGE
jgi:hypothetical protein